MVGRADAQLRWPDAPKKAPLRVRLVAIVLSDPHSSFFSSHEVVVAEKEIGHEEWSLIKLVYSYLPYQPRLSEVGFDYSVIHEFSATRDNGCDQTLADLTLKEGTNDEHLSLKYASEAPRSDLDRRRIPLPCYETTADDYTKAPHQPIPPPPPPPPVLMTRQPQ